MSKLFSIKSRGGAIVATVQALVLSQAGVLSGAEQLLYSGLTANGWQIHSLDLQTRQSRALTSSLGDKRFPSSSGAGSVVLYRTSGGELFQIDGTEAEKRYFAQISKVSGYDLVPMQDAIYFTQLTKDHKRRQAIYVCGLDDSEARLLMAPPEGSVQDVRVSPDGKYIVSQHIWTIREERIFVVPIENPNAVRYLSPAGMVAVDPCWNLDASRIFFAQLGDGGKFELWVYDLESDDARRILSDSKLGLRAPAVNASENRIYFECHSEDGVWLASSDLKRPEIVSLDLDHQGRDPFLIVEP